MNYSGKTHVRDRIIDGIVFVVLLAGASMAMLALFCRQSYYPDVYVSDMPWYIQEIQGVENGLIFPYPVFFKLSALLQILLEPELAVAVTAMLLNSAGILVVKLALNRLVLCESCPETCMSKRGWPAGIAISVLAVSLFFVSMLYLPEGFEIQGITHKYLGVFTANPFHNATYIAARPFAILAFLWYVKLLPVYEKGLDGNGIDYVLFSVFLLLATMTKPSFTLVMVSTAGIIMLYRLFREKFHNFIPSLQLGACFLPTFLDLLYQFACVYGSGNEGGELSFGIGKVWLLYCTNIPAAVWLAAGFPLMVLLLNYRQCRKNSMLCFSWQFYLTAFAEAFFLYEEGEKMLHFNFAWGYMYGIFFCNFAALRTLLCATVRKTGEQDTGDRRNVRTALLVIQWLLYLCHVICGVLYFGEIYNTEFHP